MDILSGEGAGGGLSSEKVWFQGKQTESQNRVSHVKDGGKSSKYACSIILHEVLNIQIPYLSWNWTIQL